MSPKTNLDIVYGAMGIGKGGPQSRVSSYDEVSAILDTFKKYGHTDIDTSRVYGAGTSEEYLATLKWQSRGLVIHTKFYPNAGASPLAPESHLTLNDMRAGLDQSLKALNTDSVDLWYLHAPDRSVPFEETFKGVDVLYKEGKFKRFGLSNFMSWEVAAICELCEKNGWIKPTVYQGVYNAFQRSVEHELFPCLRKYGLAFYAFNPLAGGLLTSRYKRNMSDDEVEKGSRFDGSGWQGKAYRARYFHDEFFDALEGLREVCAKYGLRESECALRWMVHHSAMKKQFDDKAIIGASSAKQLEQNLVDFEGGELPEEVLKALDKGWDGIKGNVYKYWH